jgi:hypothetical protein
MDGAPVFIKKTPSICMFSDTVSFLYGIEIIFNEKGNLNRKVFGDTHKFIFPDIYDSRFPGTAYPAPLAFKTNPLIKKIGSMV